MIKIPITPGVTKWKRRIQDLIVLQNKKNHQTLKN